MKPPLQVRPVQLGPSNSNTCPFHPNCCSRLEQHPNHPKPSTTFGHSVKTMQEKRPNAVPSRIRVTMPNLPHSCAARLYLRARDEPNALRLVKLPQHPTTPVPTKTAETPNSSRFGRNEKNGIICSISFTYPSGIKKIKVETI